MSLEFFRGVQLFLVIETQVDRALKAGQQSGQVLQAECESLGGRKVKHLLNTASICTANQAIIWQREQWMRGNLADSTPPHTNTHRYTCSCSLAVERLYWTLSRIVPLIKSTFLQLFNEKIIICSNKRKTIPSITDETVNVSGLYDGKTYLYLLFSSSLRWCVNNSANHKH